MNNVDLVWSDATAEVHRFVVGPVENNVYVVRCRQTGEALLIDAANEHGIAMVFTGVRHFRH